MAKTPEQLIRREVFDLHAYHVPLSDGMVKLDAMENPYRLPPEMRAELGAVLAEAEINRYPDPTGRHLRNLLAEKMGIPEGMEVLLGNGSDDLIQMLTLAMARPGSAVMFPDPTFVMYRMNAILMGMKPIGVLTRDDFSLDIKAFLAAVQEHRPALIFIAYPNNPTGVLYPEDEIAAIIRAAEGLVVLDEAYHVFAQHSFMPRLAEFPNLAVMRTVSKLGLAGIRLGYLAARPEWAVQFNKVRQAYNVSVLTQAAATFVLGKLDVLEKQAAVIRTGRAGLKSALEALGGLVVYPTAANFFLVRVADGQRTFESLKGQGVLVRSFHGAHPMLANCLRITVGTPEENRILLSALREAL